MNERASQGSHKQRSARAGYIGSTAADHEHRFRGVPRDWHGHAGPAIAFTPRAWPRRFCCGARGRQPVRRRNPVARLQASTLLDPRPRRRECRLLRPPTSMGFACSMSSREPESQWFSSMDLSPTFALGNRPKMREPRIIDLSPTHRDILEQALGRMMGSSARQQTFVECPIENGRQSHFQGLPLASFLLTLGRPALREH
jgi:hypothetical protein